MYTQGVGDLPSKFEKLCNYVGADLMTLVYRFLLHADGAQSERLDSAKSSKKKKNKENVPEQMSTLGKVTLNSYDFHIISFYSNEYFLLEFRFNKEGKSNVWMWDRTGEGNVFLDKKKKRWASTYRINC